MLKIRNSLYGFLLCCLLSSCATLVNGRFQTVTVHTTEASKIIVGADTIKTSNNTAQLRLTRARNSVQIVTLSESGIKKVQLKSRTSSSYYLNGFGILLPGLVIDLFSPKRFAYPENIYLHSADSSDKFKTHYIPKDGDVLFHLAFPAVGVFKLKPDHEAWTRSVGFGFGAGIDYYHTQNQYINVSGNVVLDYKLPKRKYTWTDAGEEKSSTYQLNVSNNHKINRLSLGYGLAYATNIWEFVENPFERPLSMRNAKRKKYDVLGMLFSSYYQTGQVVNIGASYRPTFLRFNAEKSFQYEHLITFDIVFKLKLGQHP
jgi:hypothetical protein